MRKIFLIDNYDSFTYNLLYYIEELGCEVTVKRNDKFDLNEINSFDAILISPGPGIPHEAGKIIEVIKLETGVNGLVTRGVNSGQTGKIEAVEDGTFILPKRVILSLGERKIEIPADIILPIGKEEPVIQIK